MTLDAKDAAVIVWMPPGKVPTNEAYRMPDGETPETQGFFEMGSALIVAVKGPPRPGKKPWIKVGSVLIPPDRQELMYEDFKMGKELHA